MAKEVKFDIRAVRRSALLIFLLLAAILPLPGVVRAGPLPQSIPDSYKPVAENAQFKLYVDSDTLAFKLLDKRSNYLWESGIDQLAEGDRLNKSWQAFALSGISIEYLDPQAVNKRVSITNSTHNLNVSPIDQGVSGQVTFQDYGITVTVNLQLEADGVRVEVPFASLQEADPKFRLGLLYVYPFLGATRGASVPGYMFMPDGTGSLIRFADSTKARTMFYGRYYGNDLGMIGVQPYDYKVNTPYPISYPVFGMVHGEGQNGFISVVEKGAAYGEVEIHPAGIITNFNFIHNAFIYNESYFQATNRSGAGVTTIQKKTNAFDAVVHFQFLTGDAANYVGMAHSYQQYLVGKGMLKKNADPNANIGIRLEFLGSAKEHVLLWDRVVTMTTIAQMGDILDKLQISNAQVVYYGWQPYGAASMPPTSLNIEGNLGSLNDLRALADKITAGGGHFLLYFDPQAAIYNQSGYSARNDLAMAITGIAMEGYNRTYNYYFTADALQQRYNALVGDIAAQLKSGGLALDELGSTLYSDFRQGSSLNRQDAITTYQKLLAGSPLRLTFYYPNDYMWGMAQAYYGMPLGDNGYIYTSEAVPFLPIVLAGYLPYYGDLLNFSSNQQEDLLRHVDYGIYPSYILTNEPTSTMINTSSAWIYTSSYAQWGDPIRHTYQWMNSLLAPVRGQEITTRQKLTDGVYATTYANGKQIIVNYNDKPYVSGGITVEAKNALLVESKP